MSHTPLASITNRNYIQDNRLLTGISRWVKYNDGAVARPVNGTEGTATGTTLSVAGTPPMLSFTKDASNRQGTGASFDFVLSKLDTGHPMSISFDYVIDSGTYSGGTASTDSDMIVYLYDVTNSKLYQPSNFKLSGAVNNANNRYTANFQPDSSTSNVTYRLILHVATTSASAYTVQFNNFTVISAPQLTTPMVTDWTAFAPTGSWVSNTTYTGFWKRIGDEMEIQVQVATSGAPTAAGLTINMPSGYTIDTAKMVDAGGLFSPVGRGFANDSDGQAYSIRVDISAANTFRVLVSGASSTYVAELGLSNTIPFTFGAGDDVKVVIKVPILGWGSSIPVYGGGEGRTVAARYGTAGAVAVSTTQPIDFATKTLDTHNAVTTGSAWKYTAPVAGNYQVSASADLDAGAAFAIYKNGTIFSTLSVADAGSFSSAGSDIVPMVAGDYIDIRLQSGSTSTSADTSRTHVAIQRISGPEIITASPYPTISIATVTSHSGGMSANSSGTYTTPMGVKYIRVRIVGGGGGGSGGGTAALTAGSDGGTTSFGTSLLSASPGSGSAFNGDSGSGGSASLGSGPVGIALSGSDGGAGGYNVAAGYSRGGSGGSSAFGGGGKGGNPGADSAAAGKANTGSGGGGGSNSASVALCNGGGGGGSGGFVDAIIKSPLTSYSYSVGGGGTGAGAGTNGYAGASGAAGIIIVEEYYW